MNLSEVDRLKLKCSLLEQAMMQNNLRQMQTEYSKKVDEYNSLYIQVAENHGYKPDEVEFNFETGEIKEIKKEVDNADDTKA